MGLLEKEIQELRVLNKRLDEGTVTTEHVHAKVAMYSQTEKRAKMILQAMATAAKYGGKATPKKIADSNLIGGGIDLEDRPDEQSVSCPLKYGKSITREDCLDLSGEAKNHEFCKGCKEFGVTRSMLLKK